MFRDVTVVGLVSSHPAACITLTKYDCKLDFTLSTLTSFVANNFQAVKISEVDTTFISQHAKRILNDSPVPYIRNTELRGSLFEEECTSGAVSCAYTKFFVDHAEPLEALEAVRKSGRWPLGEPLEGHEFLVMIPVLAQSRAV